MGKSKKSKKKPVLAVDNGHKPCPFCGSAEIAPLIMMKDDEYYNMMVLCLSCFTRYEFDMVFSPQNVSKVYEIWDKRCSDGEE